jgi:hypothetical protein
MTYREQILDIKSRLKSAALVEVYLIVGEELLPLAHKLAFIVDQQNELRKDTESSGLSK